VLSSRHLPSLDGLRGLAVLMVVAHNLSPIHPEGWLSHVLTSLLDRGWVGVQLFFVLSGFLITGILLDSQDQPRPLTRFFGARALRILPLYGATLVVVFGVLPWLGHGLGAGPRDAWPLALFISNWMSFQPGENPLPHFWSLAVEEQFYLLWPFLIPRFGLKGLVRFCLGLTVAALAIRWLLMQHGAPSELIYRYSVCRMDALACGAAAAALLRLPPAANWLSRHPGHTAMLAAVLLFSAAVSGGLTQYAAATQLLGYAFLSTGLAAAVLAVAHADLSGLRGGHGMALLRWPALGRVGCYSYGMYVLHLPLHLTLGAPLLQALRQSGLAPLPAGLAYVVLATAAVFGLAALSYHLFEARFLRLKSRLPGASGRAEPARNPRGAWRPLPDRAAQHRRPARFERG